MTIPQAIHAPPPPLPTPPYHSGSGVLNLGGTTYAVSSLASVQLATVPGPRPGWGVVVCGFSVLGILVGGALCAAADGAEKGAAIALIGLVVLITSVLALVWGIKKDKGQPIPAVLLTLTGGGSVYFIAGNWDAARQLQGQIAAAMAAGGGNVYVDNRQLHMHNHR